MQTLLFESALRATLIAAAVGLGVRVGMAMPGIGLKHRIRQMLSGVPVPRIFRPRIACTVAVCAAASVILAAGTPAHAQIPGNSSVPPAPEVASVKLRVPGQGDGSVRFSVSGTRMTLTNIPLRGLLTTAYDLKLYQILGTPSWGDTNRYNVEVKAEGELALTREQGRQVLQKLLADRFHIMLHRETKEMPVYALVAGKNPKLKPTTSDGDPLLMMGGTGGSIYITVTKGTMDQLARLVIDLVEMPSEN